MNKNPDYIDISFEKILSSSSNFSPATTLKEEHFSIESLKKYLHLFELSPVPICIHRNGKILFLNTACISLLKTQDHEQYIGKSLCDIIHPNFKSNIKESLKNNKIPSGNLDPPEIKLYCADGTEVDVEISSIPLPFLNDSISQVIFRDITKRKHTETLIKQSKHDWQDIFNGITDMITIHDKDYNILYANASAKKVLNLPAIKQGMKVKCYRYYHGTDKPPEGCPSCKCMNTGKPANFEIFEPHLDMYIEIRSMPRFDENNKISGLIHIARDVTKRKCIEAEIKKAKEELEIRVQQRTAELRLSNEQLKKNINDLKLTEEALRKSESKYKILSQQFHALLDGIPDNLILLSPDLTIMWSNKSAATTFKSTPKKLKGQYCYEMCCNILSPCHNCPTLRSFKTGREENSQITTPTGRVWDVRSFPIMDDEGNIKNVIELARDITENINLQAEAMRTRHLASLGELAAGVAHEINNPINNIINYAQILIDENGDDEIGNRILKDSDRIATIVRSLLSFARIRQEEKTLISLDEIISDTLTLTDAQIRKDGIVLKIDIPVDLPHIYAHPQQIQQVFLNIISNSRYALNEKYPLWVKDIFH
jgi:PAS domain S-box-containing protein